MPVDARAMNDRLLRLAESDAQLWQVDYYALTPAERVFRAVWELEAQVNNGGFHQYFFNASGRLAFKVVDALRAIGAAQMATIVEQAIEVVRADISWQDDAIRQGILN